MYSQRLPARSRFHRECLVRGQGRHILQTGENMYTIEKNSSTSTYQENVSHYAI